jgi:hypothetical protein
VLSGTSAKQLEQMLEVTYKTAWRMFKQIRMLMAEEGDILSRTIEIDESYPEGRVTRRKVGGDREFKTEKHNWVCYSEDEYVNHIRPDLHTENVINVRMTV